MTKKKAEQVKADEIEVGTAELAVIIGKSDRWIRKITGEGILKQVSRGKYNLAAAVQAYIEHAEGGKEDSNQPRLIDHKTEHERIKAEIASLELEEKRKNLHTTADVEHAWGILLVQFRERLMSLPPNISNDLSYINDPKKIRIMLEEHFTDALIELSKYDPMSSDDG